VIKKNSPPPTLQSIANELKIHVSTVSRVLNGNESKAKGAASAETVKKIQALALKLNYQPNLQAIGLRTNKTKTITTFLPSISDIVGALIFEGIDEAAHELGYVTFMSHTGDNIDHQREQLTHALARKVDGLIFADARQECRDLIQNMKTRGVPTVLVSRHLGPEFCSITCDDVLGGQLAAEHLLSLGHKNMAILAGFEYASTGSDRADGFQKYCHEKGVHIPKNRIFHSRFDSVAGREIGEALFRQKDIPTAVFAVNDFLAIGVMGAARAAGLHIGRDVAIVGYNDTPLAANLPIGLTSIHSPMHEMGYQSMQMLYKIINGGQPQSVFLKPHLLVRDSSNPTS
jgi:LacI family transcriptional regulator